MTLIFYHLLKIKVHINHFKKKVSSVPASKFNVMYLQNMM
jgi:hypothetical protein